MHRGKRCGWTREARHLSEKRQRAELMRHDCHPIYSASETSVAVVIKQLRAGDELWLTTLARLDTPRAELNKARKAVQAQKVVIVEALTGRRSDRAADAADMAFDAAAELMREARALPSDLAVEYGRRGGLARAVKVRKAYKGARMPVAEARGFWKDHTLSNAEALAQMTGWTARAAYRHEKLGRRGLAKGRPRKA